ncbi:unnamed protein product [Schistosoma intercalatum]|nr:unnamed protein product [Schistosoma intercalatum]
MLLNYLLIIYLFIIHNFRAQESKAAIGFVYEDSTCFSEPTVINTQPSTSQDNSDTDDEADSDMDIDVELDASALTAEARRQLAKSAATFGLHPSDFLRLLDADQQLEVELRLAKALEEEKLQLSGRKSRRSRRLLRERRAQEKFPRLLTTKCDWSFKWTTDIQKNCLLIC